ncbi:alpha/beta hydrolase [Nocardioides sp. MAHUQ-72]|uniref:alpha/beta hydrolase n=1 Tax=unclassified Nocardioides TaxID=2615069 RepID=UPI0036110A50
MSLEQVTDVLGEPYLAETMEFPPDDEGAVVATLVSRAAGTPTTRAVLHVHGFADYFFQTGYAEWWNARGYDFYAVDLRKYGRSIRPHQTPNYITDLRDYFPDLDATWSRITNRDGHDHVVLSAHSTGGLVLSLWAHERGGDLDALGGMVLNSPWLDLQGSALLRTVGTTVIKQLGRRRPRREIPRRVDGLYARSLHRDHDGEWEFDLSWKPLKSWPVFAGWLAAIRHGHAELHRGLDVRCPVLVLSSDRSTLPSAMGDDVHSHDIVLDVEHIRRWSTAIGRHVTYAAVPGARHDVVLSLPGPRAAAYDEISRWHTAYVG